MMGDPGRPHYVYELHAGEQQPQVAKRRPLPGRRSQGQTRERTLMADNASMNDEQDQRRKDFAAGLHTLADAIGAGTIPFPSRVVYGDVHFYAHSAEEFHAIADRLEYVRHEISGGTTAARLRFRLSGTVGGVLVSVHGDPQWVCDREVVGTVEDVRWTFRGQPVEVSA